ncbi:MAG TPA: dockerin type I repeat-containing protein [Bacteroidales bacterium]|nr:dockerin type I repeat-containing protein [Bacteroidales bacterium]HSA42762.1 dockerin type I repeat-containing protein [Bacteroidales bacterium]
MAMRSFLIGILLCLSGLTGSAQFILQQVTATAGSVEKSGGLQLSATLGELAVTRLPSSAYQLTQGFQQAWRSYHAWGKLSYLNMLNTPLGNSMVYLFNMNGMPADSTLTRPDGSFYFFRPVDDTVIFDAMIAQAWGGVNATDALLVLKHFTGFIQLQDLYYRAADVDGSENVNSIDALMIARRYAGLITAFPAGDWSITRDTMTTGVLPLYFESEALCTGDVNGSFQPGLKTASAPDIISRGTLFVPESGLISIPLHVTEKIKLGAVSLVLGNFQKYFHIEEVSMNCNHGSLCWKAFSDQLRIAWWSDREFSLAQESPLMFILLRMKTGVCLPDEWCLRPEEESELADPDGNSLQSILLCQPGIQFLGKNESLQIGKGIPNPAKLSCSFPVFLTEPALIRVSLKTAAGACVREYTHDFPAGANECTLDLNDCIPGIYLARFEITMQRISYTCSRKVILIP